MRSTRFILMACALAVVAVTAAAVEPLDVATTHALEFKRAFTTPELTWCADGRALLYDLRRPPAERTLERLDPATGARTAAVDARAALASLATLLGPDAEAPEELEWPDDLDGPGRRGLYAVAGDLFLLDLAHSSFQRLTATAADEKNPRFSPDGRRASFVRANDLFVFDLATGVEHRLTTDGSDTQLNGTLSWVYWEEIFDREDTASWWSPDSTAIAFFASDESRVDETVFPDFEPIEPVIHRQRYPKAGSVNPTVRLGIVDVGSGKVTWAKLPEPAPEYLIRVCWLPDGSGVALQTLDRIQRRLDLLLIDRATGASRGLLTETMTTSVTVNDDLRFLADGRFLWSSERGGAARLELHAADGSLITPVTPAELTLRASQTGGGAGTVCAVDEENSQVYFTAISRADTGSPIAPQLYRVGLNGAGFERVSSVAGTHRVAFDRHARFYLDRFSAATTPPALVLHRADGSEVATVAPPAADLVARCELRSPEFFSVKAPDGFALPAGLMKPAGFDPGRRYPVILYVYGGPGAPVVRDAWDRDAGFNNLLLQAGYVWVEVDPRSATGRSKALEDDAYGRLLAAHEVSDIEAVVAWLKAQPWIDPQRIGVWGWSGGGSFTEQLMTHSDSFAAGIAVAGVSDFRYYDTVWTEHRLELPEQNPDGYRVSAPAEFAGDLHGRLLLVHGTFDDNVHPQNLWRFAHELITAKIPFDMMIYPMQKHGIRADREHLHAKMLDFWKKNL